MGIEASATVKINSKSLDEIKKSKPWFSASSIGWIAIIFLALMDLGGFVQGAFTFAPETWDTETTLVQIANNAVLIVMVSGFIAAFELSTLYMAYAFSLKLYHYDRQAIKNANESGKKEKNIRFSKSISTNTLGWLCAGALLIGIM